MPKKEKIEQMFNDIAPSYDRLNHLMSLGIDNIWRKKALKEIVDGTQQQILDVACGTGDSTIAIAKAMEPGGRVTGIDISAGMMEPLMRKAAHEGVHDRIKLLQADALQMPFEADTFHRVTCAFGIRNFEDRKKGLAEFLRVLKPGGRAVILELGIPDKPFIKTLYDIYFRHILPLIGGLISGNRAAYRYLPESVYAFPRPETFCAMMERAGFHNVRHRNFTFGLCRLFIGEK
ncbi:MAG: bifunctional demethylmenaquinone methyltransferase/2-methoxy-6-polyprenyl-1,4-benzoquinol methylase UbiE [Bacteroidales bacterium]|nr:bifunctional demethylmenaquinone methyltransferase/2-methoxy-6-polyprenyl-1,4-benzoquinol methylase UbiE [Bacteroidales bacterium]